MADLINRQHLLEYLCKTTLDRDWLVNQYNADWLYSWLESQPAIDPASLRPKGECKFCSKEDNGALCWDCSDLGISIEYRAGRIRVTNEYGDEAYLGVHFCPNCGRAMEVNNGGN